jgi:Ca2+/Na+ antiporter
MVRTMEWIARLRDQRRAGSAARLHFKRTRRAWRRRVFRRVALPVYVLLFAIFIAEFSLGDFSIHWWFGVAFGFLMTAFLALRDAPPHHIENWRTGAEGERRTARQLSKLRSEGWRPLHDLATKRGNRDHVVVGPGGIYLLDTKTYGGRVAINGNAIQVTRIDNDRGHYSSPQLVQPMRRAAVELSKDIKQHGGEGKWVHPVVVIWAKFEQRVVEVDGVTFVHGDDLVSWLHSRPKQVAQAGYSYERTVAAIEAAARIAEARRATPAA